MLQIRQGKITVGQSGIRCDCAARGHFRLGPQHRGGAWGEARVDVSRCQKRRCRRKTRVAGHQRLQNIDALLKTDITGADERLGGQILPI